MVRLKVGNGSPICNIEVHDQTEFLAISLVDKKIFEAFIADLLPCNQGKFYGGVPRKSGEGVNFSYLKIVFDDTLHSSTMKFDGQISASWEYNYKSDEDLVEIVISISKEFIESEYFDDYFTFLIAARVDDIANFNTIAESLDRNRERGDKYLYPVEKIGISYEKNY